MKSFIDQYRTMLSEAVEMFGMVGLQNIVGVDRRNIKKWVDGEGFPRADSLAKLADAMGWRLVKTGVNADNHLEAEDFVQVDDSVLARTVNLSDYEAIPLIDSPDVLTESGHIPDGHIAHYGLIHKSTPFLQGCSPHLVAVAVLESSIGTMIEKSDTVIFDLNDRELEEGRVYLVRTPKRYGGKTMIRRVMVSGEGEGQRFTFYSETHNVPSQSYALWEYEGDTVILGRGVWFRGDLRNL